MKRKRDAYETEVTAVYGRTLRCGSVIEDLSWNYLCIIDPFDVYKGWILLSFGNYFTDLYILPHVFEECAEDV